MSTALLEMQPRNLNAAAGKQEFEPDFLAAIRRACEMTGEHDWTVRPGQDLERDWIRVGWAGLDMPAQGWKLHLSASIASAADVLRHALPILLAEPIVFKIAGSPRMLTALNQGEGQLSQVGKFMTIYPSDDAQAVRLAAALHTATEGLLGPAIPSDRALAPGSLVHYRYGGFGDAKIQTSIGEILPALTKPDGTLIPDRRGTVYAAPDWVEDPFVLAGVAAPLAEQRRTIADRYVIVTTLHRSPRGMVYLAMDLDSARRCVLKRAMRGATIGAGGLDARDRLRHEAVVLRALSPHPGFPEVYDLIEQDGDLYMAMEDLEGETLEAHVGTRAARNDQPSPAEVIAWGRALAGLLGAVHDAGFAYRDLKTPNVIVMSGGALRLLDFELAHPLHSVGRTAGYGTRGYVSPQAAAGEPVAITDDVYGLGALLFFMATAAEPSMAPREFALLDRPVELLNPAMPKALCAIIGRCLASDPSKRFASMAALDAALASVPTARKSRPSRVRRSTPTVGWRQYGAMARRLGDTLCAEAQPQAADGGVAWITRHPIGAGIHSRDINTGSAGPVLALAELVAAYGDPSHRQTLAAGARWLAQSPHLGDRPLAGLYVGEAGVGAALLRAGQILGDADLLEAAEARGNLVAAQPFGSPDLFNGTAGRLRFHLWLWNETQQREHLHAAIAAGESLLAAAEWHGAGDAECRWPIPPGFGGLSGTAYTGYAHGASGIADALLDLYEVTGDQRYLAPALGAYRWLARLAHPALPDGTGIDWPPIEGAQGGRLWCHGAVGTGRFILHGTTLGVIEGGMDIARRAALTAVKGARAAGPVQCHGLAGCIELALDWLAVEDSADYRAEIDILARLLGAFAVERDGNLMFPSESPNIFSPDYMVGYAGIALCLLRLSNSGIPHQLSRTGFRRPVS
jgi:hypothetical protein